MLLRYSQHTNMPVSYLHRLLSHTQVIFRKAIVNALSLQTESEKPCPCLLQDWYLTHLSEVQLHSYLGTFKSWKFVNWEFSKSILFFLGKDERPQQKESWQHEKSSFLDQFLLQAIGEEKRVRGGLTAPSSHLTDVYMPWHCKCAGPGTFFHHF